MDGVLDTISFREAVMRERADAYWSTASALADSLVTRADLPFRDAHYVVARLVRNAIADGRRPDEVTTGDLDAAATETIGRELGIETDWIRRELDASHFVASRRTAGSVSEQEIDIQLGHAAEKLRVNEAWQTREEARLEEAAATLQAGIDRIRATQISISVPSRRGLGRARPLAQT